MIKAAIYDLDDLMVNSITLHEKAWDVLLATYSLHTSDIPEDLRSSFVGRRVIDIADEIISYFHLPVNPKDFYQQRQQIFLKLVADQLQTMPGLVESLELFRNNGMKIALASSGMVEYINLVLKKFDIEKFFDIIITGDDVQKGKPDPETYHIACQKLGLPPTDCLVLEDATAGIASAKAAGCKCIAIINKFTLSQDLSQADLILNSLIELNLSIINSL